MGNQYMTEDAAAPASGLRINGTLHPVPESMTLGELRTVKRSFGVNLADGENLPLNDPDVMAAMVWIVLHRADSTVTVEQVDELDIQSITAETEDEVEGVAVPPPAPAVDSAASVPSASGETGPARPSLEMIRAVSGSRAS